MKTVRWTGVWLACLVTWGCGGGVDVTGHYEADPAAVTEDLPEGLADLRVTLDVRDDQTFRMRIESGTEGNWSQTGTWVLRAGSLWMTAKGEDGKPQTIECPLREDGSFVIDDGRQHLVMRPLREPGEAR